MNRKKFIKCSALGIASGLILLKMITSRSRIQHEKNNSYLEDDQVGVNHLPHQPSSIMKNMVLHRAETRGQANHGWLNSRHTFSFANYHNAERMHFGVLRVLNDDQVEAGMGFGTHPHQNMEIISIPLEGDLEHKDSMGNIGVIKQGDVQVMSAGTGVEHSEHNKNKDRAVHFLQIWVFPREKGVAPRYDQASFKPADRVDNWQQILSPSPDDEGVWIHQDAWFYLSKLSNGKQLPYTLRKADNGIYAFMISGEAKINGQELKQRDGLGVWSLETLQVEATADSEILLMEVPMQ